MRVILTIMKREKVGAVIVAAGKGERMGGRDKVFAKLGGRPLIARVIDTFEECRAIDEIVLVLSVGNLVRGKRLVNRNGWSKVTSVCLGGARRQDSVHEGLKRLSDCEWAVIHDGARPLVNSDIITRGLADARESGAAIAGVPVKDTIKLASPEGFVRETPRRDGLWAIQTPQVFRFDLIVRAHEAITEDVTDDAAMMERMGYQVKIYMGSYENVKITTPEDLALVETILRNR